MSGVYQKIMLKASLKAHFAVNAWTHASVWFTEMVNTYEGRQQFTQYAFDYF